MALLHRKSHLEEEAVMFHHLEEEGDNSRRNSRNTAPSADAAPSAAAAPKRMLSRGHSSAREVPETPPPPMVASGCFIPEFLSEPLLQDRGASSAAAQRLFGTPPPRLSISWEGITQWVPAPTATDPKARKRILCNVSGRVYSGETLAIMGPSGSGKTSLLSLLSGGWRKTRDAGNLDGAILVNGKPSTKRMKRFIAYVAQDDLLFANLTVEQTLKYSALLNLPKELTREQKLQRVNSVIELLGLTKCRGTPIGGPWSRGISGGERKRTSVANEMLANPSLIMADEPTSGLDSTTAARLINTFRSLARGGRAVICSIHQPSSQTFDLFDKVLLLAQGRTIFYGSTQQVIAYFGSVGLMCKPYYNPADFVLEVVSDLTHEGIAKEEELEKKQKQMNGSDGHAAPTLPLLLENGADLEKGASPLAAATHTVMLADDQLPKSYNEGYQRMDAARVIRRLPIEWARLEREVLELEASTRQRQIEEQDRAEEAGAAGGLTLTAEEKQLAEEHLDTEGHQSNRWPLTWWEQFTLLMSRSYLQHKGERITKLYAAQVLCIAIVCGLVWFRTDRVAVTLPEQTGALFFVTIFWSFTPLFNSLTTFPSERAIIIKERASGSYRLSAYFMAKIVAEAPVELMYPIIFMLMCYFMIGFKETAGGFFFTILTILLSTLCAQSYGLLISCTLLDFKQSITFASVSMLTLMLLSGFYVKLANIPIWLRWLSYLVFPKYAYSILAYIQFQDSTFDCGDEAPIGVTFTSCPVRGSEVMSAYDFNTVPLWGNIVILLSMTLVFRAVAYIALRKTTRP